ncbi:MAG: class I SAM-dependent methyltransferase [Nitrospira sp.]|nr:class I SAM-dependent methyltransferase [Nitrospira sp.]
MANPLRRWLAQSELFSFNVVRRDRWIAAQARELPPGTKVLDVGAGSCPYRHFFAHCKYETQDFVALCGDQLRNGGYGQIDYVCDLTAIPRPAGSFDAVLCTEVLEHHPEPIAVVKELGRVLAPGGRLILTAPLGSGIHQEPYHYYGGYTPWWYERFLKEAGFEDINIAANEGSLRFFGQESLRFVRTTSPFSSNLPVAIRLLWFPIWIVLAPLLGVVLPVSCKLLDKHDREQRFTVGYHVSARRSVAIPHS